MKIKEQIISATTQFTKKQRILFLIPPNIRFEDFADPPKHMSTISKNNGKDQFGSVLTDIPLGIISMSAYLKKYLQVETKTLDFNVTLNKDKAFEYSDFYS